MMNHCENLFRRYYGERRGGREGEGKRDWGKDKEMEIDIGKGIGQEIGGENKTFSRG